MWHCVYSSCETRLAHVQSFDFESSGWQLSEYVRTLVGLHCASEPFPQTPIIFYCRGEAEEASLHSLLSGDVEKVKWSADRGHLFYTTHRQYPFLLMLHWTQWGCSAGDMSAKAYITGACNLVWPGSRRERAGGFIWRMDGKFQKQKN